VGYKNAKNVKGVNKFERTVQAMAWNAALKWRNCFDKNEGGSTGRQV
jgi:hypothetical protein